MKALLLVLALLGSGRGLPNRTDDYAETVEVNYFHDPVTGRHAYTQLIFWEWSYDWNRQHVVGWHIVDSLHKFPALTAGGRYLTIKKSEDGKREVYIWSDYLRVTWTRTDPERLNKSVFAEKYRRGIGKK